MSPAPHFMFAVSDAYASTAGKGVPHEPMPAGLVPANLSCKLHLVDCRATTFDRFFMIRAAHLVILSRFSMATPCFTGHHFFEQNTMLTWNPDWWSRDPSAAGPGGGRRVPSPGWLRTRRHAAAAAVADDDGDGDAAR